MRKFIEFCEDYWSYLTQPDTLTGLFITSCVAAVTTILIIFG